jgi:hypothetical protein
MDNFVEICPPTKKQTRKTRKLNLYMPLSIGSYIDPTRAPYNRFPYNTSRLRALWI